MIANKETIEKLKEPLTDEEIEIRVGNVIVTANGQWVTFLAYKTARTDANRLDEIIGADNWSSSYDVKGNIMFCEISIMTTNGWVSKEDCGDDNKQGHKGSASDAFKRAGFKWGIGRELYDFPTIFVTLRPDEVKDKKMANSAKIQYWKMKRVNGKVTIVDNKNVERFKER